MSKSRSFSFSGMKNYFLNQYPHVKNVDVEVHKEGPHDFVARLKVKAGSRWFVVKKRGEEVSEALSRAKEAMNHKVRKEWGKYKNHRNLSHVELFHSF